MEPILSHGCPSGRKTGSTVGRGIPAWILVATLLLLMQQASAAGRGLSMVAAGQPMTRIDVPMMEDNAEHEGLDKLPTSRGSTRRFLMEQTQVSTNTSAQLVEQNKDALEKLVKAFCFQQSGRDCDVDLEHTTSWYRYWFDKYNFPVVSLTAGASQPGAPTPPTVLSESVGQAFCPYVNNTTYRCQVDQRLITSNKVTVTNTKSNSFDFYVGFTGNFNIPLGEGPGQVRVGVNVGVSAGYSTSSSEGTSEVDGYGERVAIYENFFPAQESCALLEVSAQRLKSDITTETFMEMSGWVGTQQSDNFHWPDIDPQGQRHHARAFNIAEIVAWGNARAIYSFREWSYDSNSDKATLKLDATIHLDAAGRGYSTPKFYPISGPVCGCLAKGGQPEVCTTQPKVYRKPPPVVHSLPAPPPRQTIPPPVIQRIGS